MSYRKGYRREKHAVGYMEMHYGCKCVESRGSHGVADLICGNGETVYVIQVKSGKTLPYISWEELEEYAQLFKGVPLFLYKPDYRSWVECWKKGDLMGLKISLRRWFKH